MTPNAFLARLKADKSYQKQIEHIEHIPPRVAKYERLARPLNRDLAAAIRGRGVTRLYSHQAQAINLARDGQDVVVATGTASGKTLCYNAPVLDAILDDPQARALYLFPTKALAQDQLRSLDELVSGLGKRVRFGTYDGDTPPGERAALRRTAHILLTNPDMLSLGILPNHNLWVPFLSNLRYIVIDEAHVYRGVFGSQVACVLRRLLRICTFYNCHPQFICCSATIANPREHILRLASRSPHVVNGDGAGRGAKDFVLWNPPLIKGKDSGRKSANSEAAPLFAALVEQGMRNIAFARARKTAELIVYYARERLRKSAPELTDKIRVYRAGYLPEQRRQIEAGLFKGGLVGVAATNALELGIDVGDLDATILVGFPGTMASLWQQAGRAGRGTNDTLSFLVAANDPLDQYFVRHPDLLFKRPVEHALIHPDNPYILDKHLPCAAHELPLTREDAELFGPGFANAVTGLEQKAILQQRGDKWFYRNSDYPADQVNLRSITSRFVSLVNQRSGEVMEEIDAATAPHRVHEGAIYLHQGETYLVTKLDLTHRIARLKPTDVDYYTDTTDLSETRIQSRDRERTAGSTRAYFGDVLVTEQVIAYQRKKHYSDSVLARVELDLPPQSFTTKAVWWDIPAPVVHRIQRSGGELAGALHAAEHACIGLLPLFAMCDRWDIGGLSTDLHPDTRKPQVFIYDGFPGGVGISEKGFEILEDLWQATLEAIEKCPCESGCPSCIHSPKCGNNNEPLDKNGAITLLRFLLDDRSGKR